MVGGGDLAVLLGNWLQTLPAAPPPPPFTGGTTSATGDSTADADTMDALAAASALHHVYDAGAPTGDAHTGNGGDAGPSDDADDTRQRTQRVLRNVRRGLERTAI